MLLFLPAGSHSAKELLQIQMKWTYEGSYVRPRCAVWIPDRQLNSSCYPADFIACLLNLRLAMWREESYGTRGFHEGPGNTTTTVELLKSPEFIDKNLL